MFLVHTSVKHRFFLTSICLWNDVIILQPIIKWSNLAYFLQLILIFRHMVSPSDWRWPLCVTLLAWPCYVCLFYQQHTPETHSQHSQGSFWETSSWWARNTAVGKAASCPNKTTFTSMSKGHMVRNVENSLLWSEKRKKNLFSTPIFMKALELREEQSRFLFLVYSLMFLSLLNPRKKFHLTKQLQNIKNTGVKVQDKKALTVVGWREYYF